MYIPAVFSAAEFECHLRDPPPGPRPFQFIPRRVSTVPSDDLHFRKKYTPGRARFCKSDARYRCARWRDKSLLASAVGALDRVTFS